MRYRTIPVILIILTVLSADLFAAMTVKLGSIIPSGSPWDTSLKKLAAQWQKISKGTISLKIYPGGMAGDESDMIRKIRIGQLDAAGISAVGMSGIYKGILSIQLPFLTESANELNYVMNKIKPYFESNMEGKGFMVLTWSDAGRGYFFSRRPIIKPDDLRSQKMFLWEGDANMVKTLKELGFNPVPLAATEIMTALQSGMVDALMNTPTLTASAQLFGIAGNMCNMELAPFIGAIVISKKVWDRISPDLRPELKKVTEEIGEYMRNNTIKADNDALAIMKKYGLKIHSVSDDIKKEWHQIYNDGYNKLMGKSIDKESYEKVQEYIREYRKSRAK